MVANSMVQLSVARATKSPFATEMNLLPKRSGGSGPLATFGVVRCPGPSVYPFSNCGTKSPGESFSTSRQLLTSLSVAFFPRRLGFAGLSGASCPRQAGPRLPEAGGLSEDGRYVFSAIISRIRGHLG